MYRHEKTFLFDFIVLSILVLGTVYCGLSSSFVYFGIWLAMAIIKFVILILHQIKWRLIYKEEHAQINNNKEDEN